MELLASGAEVLVTLPAIAAGEPLRLGDLLQRAAPAPWLVALLLLLFTGILLLNALNAYRAFCAAPSARVVRIGKLLSAGRLDELREFCEVHDGIVSRSIRAGLTGNREGFDRAAALSAWQALMDRYEWWPKLLIALGLAVGFAALPLVMLHAGNLLAEVLNRFAEAWMDPPVRSVLRQFAEAVIVTGTVAGLLCSASVIAGLIFLQSVRVAKIRATSRLLVALGGRGTDG